MLAMVYECKGKSVINFTDSDVRGDTRGFDPDNNNDITMVNCPNVTGAFYYLPQNMTGQFVVSGCPMYGELGNLPKGITGAISLENVGLVMGSIADLPEHVSSVTLRGLNYVTGSVDDMLAKPDTMKIGNCPLITGTLAALVAHAKTFTIDGDLGGITGTISDLNNVEKSLTIMNTGMGGILSPKATLTYLHLEKNGMSTDDVDQTIVNLDALGTSNGTLIIEQERTYLGSTSHVTSLESRGWTVTESDPPVEPVVPPVTP